MAIDNLKVVPGESYKGKNLEFMNGNYYSLISEGAIPSFEKPNTFQEIKFKNDSSYQSYLLIPSARDENTRIQISEIEILATM